MLTSCRRLFSVDFVRCLSKIKPTAVVAFGGNALLRRGQTLSYDNQKENIEATAGFVAHVAKDFNLVLSHGNGPQVGLLALQNSAYKPVPPYPLDVLGAESQAMIGYMLAQNLGNKLNKLVTTVVTSTVVDGADPAFKKPSKPVGPVYTKEEALKLAEEKGWSVAPDGKYYRRVVPSPLPKKIVELPAIRTLLDAGHLVISCGGGGIPVVEEHGEFKGIEAVIDKDRCASVLACELKADCLIILTDVEAIMPNFPKTDVKIKRINPKDLDPKSYPSGSMGPKVASIVEFVKKTGGWGAIGSMHQCKDVFAKKSGTIVDPTCTKTEYY